MNPSRFDKLQVKLFLAIAAAIAALTVAAYYVFTASFERGFIQYLTHADEVRLDSMIGRLAEGYARQGSWTWIAGDRQRWIDMSRESLGLPAPQSQTSAEEQPPPRRDTPLTIDPRLMLFDRDHKQLIGRPEAITASVLKPVAVSGVTVGYLGYIPRPEVIESIERVYLKRQRVAFASIAVGMTCAALLLAAGLAYWLTRRIRLLAQGTHALIGGDYEARVDAGGNDELAQLAADFNKLAATLSTTRQVRRQWVADIAHELRTPLAVLRAEIESLEDGIRPLDQAALRSLAHESSRLSRLVEDLHTLSLSDLGALSYYKEPTHISEVITDVVHAQRRELTETGLSIELDLPHGPRVLADETRLSQVFSNLLQNNLRYTHAPGEIHVALRISGTELRVEWEDSGPGVPPEDLPLLTRRLYRVEGSRNRASGGSGLGLAIAKAIIEEHGGQLSVRESARGGLAIQITLPLYTGSH